MTQHQSTKTADKASDWIQDGSLLYRLKNGANCAEINITMSGGSREESARRYAAKELLSIIESHDELLEALKKASLALKGVQLLDAVGNKNCGSLADEIDILIAKALGK